MAVQAGLLARLAENRRKVPARAVPAHPDARLIDAKIDGVCKRPVKRRQGVLHGCRKGMLRGMPIVDVQHPDTGLRGQKRTPGVTGPDAAENTPSLMKIDHKRLSAGRTGRLIKTRLKRASIARGERKLAHGHARGPFSIDQGESRSHRGTGILRGN